MKQQEAIALIMFLQRASTIVPTTGSEWGTISQALRLIEDIANGKVEIEVKPVGPAESSNGS
jgi:hypothetical protein